MSAAAARSRGASVLAVLALSCVPLPTRLTPATGQSSSLTVPAYGNLSTREGYFTGAEGVRLFYRVAGNSGDVIVFLHGGPGLGIDDGRSEERRVGKECRL